MVEGKSARWTPFLYLFPAALIVVVFRMLPISLSFIVSLFDWGIAGPKSFVWLANYGRLLTDAEFWRVMLNTFYFVIGVVPFSIFFALFFAVLLNQKIRGVGVFRTIYFLPTVTSLVAISMIWKWIYKNTDYGLANYLLHFIGIEPLKWLEEPTGIFTLIFGNGWPDFLAGPSLALVAIIVMSVWRSLGYNIIIFLAGLQNIPSTYYEAASIDGANRWQQFWKITFPLLSPTTFYVLIMTTITSFQVFTQIYLMTGPPVGGPSGTTKVIVYYLFEQGFDVHDMGYASAIALVLFVIILALTLIQRKYVEKKVHYE